MGYVYECGLASDDFLEVGFGATKSDTDWEFIGRQLLKGSVLKMIRADCKVIIPSA